MAAADRLEPLIAELVIAGPSAVDLLGDACCHEAACAFDCRSAVSDIDGVSIPSMKRLSTEATTVEELHAPLGHLSRAGHLLPEALSELGDRLNATVAKRTESADLVVDVRRCQELLHEAADLAHRAGTVLRNAQEAIKLHE